MKRARRNAAGPGTGSALVGWSILLAGRLALGLCGLAQPAAATAPVVYDLVGRFPLAEVFTETDLINFGAREASPFLMEGWSAGSETERPRPILWGTGERSQLRVFIVHPRPLTVWFRCWPFHTKESPPQRLTIEVNGTTVKKITLSARARRYQVQVPARALVSGENRLVFRYAYSRPAPAPGVPGVDSGQTLAVAWDWLQIGGAQRPSKPRARRDGNRPALIMPLGTEVDYYVKLFPGALLTIEDLVPWGAADNAERADLQVRLQVGDAGEPRKLIVPKSSAAGPRRIPLPVSSAQLARLSFRVSGDGAQASNETGWQVIRPTVTQGLAPARENDTAATLQPAADEFHERPNIIIYLVDTLRADHLGCYGYPKPTSPNIDAFAREATRFSATVAQSSHTKPTVASLFTGLTPYTHGLQSKEDALPSSAVTLAELLEDAGYETASIFTSRMVGRVMGLAQGFRSYEFIPEKDNPRNHQHAGELNRHAFRWLERRPSDRPFFLYLHATDPHDPYLPPSPYRERFSPQANDPKRGFLRERHAQLVPSDQEELRSLYDGEIGFTDASFGALLDELKWLGLYESALIIFTADHGEEFYDHGGWGHGATLYSELTSIPLVVKFPNRWSAGRIVSSTARQIDVMPTILAYLGVEIPRQTQGQSLLPFVSGDPARVEPAPAFALRDNGKGKVMESVTVGKLTLIHNLAGRAPDVELYDLSSDPAERHNVASMRPVTTGYLRSLLGEFRQQHHEPLPATKVALDPATDERLRALGY